MKTELKNYKPLFSYFLSQHQDYLHFAAHSHHFWPDATRAAQLAAWEDAARTSDKKWETIFEKIIPDVRKSICSDLELNSPEMITLAPNTHDLLIKVFSPFFTQKKVKILTTDSEFYSFNRQIQRWMEVNPEWELARLETKGLLHKRSETLSSWQKKLESETWDVIFLSQVYFNSGIALEISEFEKLIQNISDKTVIVLDGYHAYGALPTSLKNVGKRIFYLGGGYKYAMSGEGVCFMSVPEKFTPPTLTGWFAEYADLSKSPKGRVAFSNDGMAFWGATADPTGWYRFQAVKKLFKEQNINISVIHEHVLSLQKYFLNELKNTKSFLNELTPLFKEELTSQGHFLTFESSTLELGEKIEKDLYVKKVLIDRRNNRLRFGFGIYHNYSDIDDFFKRLKS